MTTNNKTNTSAHSNAKFQSLMMSPPHSHENQKQKQSCIALGMQSQIADEGYPFSEQLQNVQINHQNQQDFLIKAHKIKPQTYMIPHHNMTLISKNKENVQSLSQNKIQTSKQSNYEMIIKSYSKVAKIDQIKWYQIQSKMSRDQQSYNDLSLKIRSNQTQQQSNNDQNKKSDNNITKKLNQYRQFPLPFKYEFDSSNPLTQSILPAFITISSHKQSDNMTNNKQTSPTAQKLLMTLKRSKYLFNIPLNFNQAQYFLKLKVKLQKNCGFRLYYVNKYQWQVKNFKYQIVKLLPNIVRVRCLITVQNKVQRVWKELQVPICLDPNVHVPQSNQSKSQPEVQVCIQNISYCQTILKINQFQICLNLQHPYQQTGYICIEADSSGVQIKHIMLESGKSKKQNDINIGGCEGECRLI